MKKQKDDSQVHKTDNLAEELEKYKSAYLRALADYQNLEKRMDSQIEEVRKKTKKHLMVQFLDILDTIERAEIFMQDEGLKMVKNRFLTIFTENGVKEIDLVGKEYDPYFAEAIEVIEGEKDNIIAEVIRKGYTIGEDLLRHAEVKVTKKITKS